jgi:hypothetical protein
VTRGGLTGIETRLLAGRVGVPVGTRHFSKKYRSYLVSSQLPVKGYPVSFLKENLLLYKFIHSILSSAELKNYWGHTSSPLIRLQVLDWGNFTFSLSLSNGARARGGPRPPSRVSSILPGLGQLFSNFFLHSIFPTQPGSPSGALSSWLTKDFPG